MVDQDTSDPQFDAMTARLLRREALRRATEELSTMTGPGLENALARISTEVTEEAAYKHAAAAQQPSHVKATPQPKPPKRQE
jgi:phage shock protein A